MRFHVRIRVEFILYSRCVFGSRLTQNSISCCCALRVRVCQDFEFVFASIFIFPSRGGRFEEFVKPVFEFPWFRVQTSSRLNEHPTPPHPSRSVPSPIDVDLVFTFVVI